MDIEYVCHLIDGRPVWFAVRREAVDSYSQALRAASIPQPALEHVRRRQSQHRRDFHVADIGANIGTVALPAALCHDAHVLAVEALASNHALLLAATLRNGAAGQVIPVCMAAFSDVGVVPIAGSSAWGVIGPRIVEGSLVSAAPIADILELYAFQPDLIKIDIEGAELGGLTGIERVCTANPWVEFVVEINSLTCGEWGYSGQDLCRRFELLGFALFAWTNLGNLTPISSDQPHPDVYFDVLATRADAAYLRDQLGYTIGQFDQFDVLRSFETLACGEEHMRNHVIVNAACFAEDVRGSERFRAMLETAHSGGNTLAGNLATQAA